MRIRFVPLALLAAIVGTNGGVDAQELPPPRIIVPPSGMFRPVLPPPYRPGQPVLPLAASPYPPPGYQPSAYQVWQNYTVTYSGWMRPRVLQTPRGGGYFLYNGAPYPYSYVMPEGHQGLTLAPAGAPAP